MLATTEVPHVRLRDGASMPLLGLGVFELPDADIERSVSSALEAGYRAFDTAAAYGNEAVLGRALAASGIARDALFVTSKLWNTQHAPLEAVVAAARRSADLLGVEQLDLFLVHWPNSAAGTHVAAWEGMIAARNSGHTRSIGVSNYLPRHLDDLSAAGLEDPVVNQIERHPLHARSEVIAANDCRGIATVAWSPLARGALINDPLVGAIATAHDVSAARVLLRWNVQTGVAVIPKSANRSRILDNGRIFEFQLTEREMSQLDALDGGVMVADPELARFQ